MCDRSSFARARISTRVKSRLSLVARRLEPLAGERFQSAQLSFSRDLVGQRPPKELPRHAKFQIALAPPPDSNIGKAKIEYALLRFLRPSLRHPTFCRKDRAFRAATARSGWKAVRACA